MVHPLVPIANKAFEDDARSRRVDGWQPIGTVCKEDCGYDNPVLLLVDWDGMAYVGFWGKNQPHDKSRPKWRLKWDHRAPADLDKEWKPTHWMPLPDLPTISSRE